MHINKYKKLKFGNCYKIPVTEKTGDPVVVCLIPITTISDLKNRD